MEKFKIKPINKVIGTVELGPCCNGSGVELFLNGKSIGFLDGNNRKLQINADALTKSDFDSTVHYY